MFQIIDRQIKNFSCIQYMCASILSFRIKKLNSVKYVYPVKKKKNCLGINKYFCSS